MDAAEEAFGRLGFVAARLEDIARSVGVTRPSLLYHFGSKNKLYGEVVRRAFGMLRHALKRPVERECSFEELLDDLLEAYLSLLHEHPGLASLLLRELFESRGAHSKALLRELVPLLSWLETTLRERGQGIILEGLPVRAAILQVGTASLVQVTAPEPLRTVLWGKADETRRLAHLLFTGRF